MQYLGCPLFAGRCKKAYFLEMVRSVINRMMSWMAKLLSARGTIIVIKHVLLAILTHLFVPSCPPKCVISLLERVMENFLWGEREGGF